jgi:tyrosyl-tRNA synthetase
MPSTDLSRLVFGAAEVVSEGELEDRLGRGRPLRVKLGIDPSRPDLHLGHAVVLRKLRQFQDAGHTAVLIIGDFTGLVGDPSGQSDTRPMLSAEEMEANARTYFEQAGRVLDMSAAEVRHNSEWLAALSMAEVLELCATTTVARMLERDDFQKRYRAGRPISVVEFLYPLMQAMDSVRIEADVELGGTDQTFNLLMGRDVQRAHGQEPQIVLTVPLLEGTDGVRKMSKSLDNWIALTDPPEEMFGKLMRVPDELVVKYLALCTDLPPEEVGAVEAGLADGSRHPAEEKRGMAREIVALYHGPEAATAAEEDFNRKHRDHELPPEVPAVEVRRAEILAQDEQGATFLQVPALLVSLGLAATRSEARRLLDQGGVRRDGEVFREVRERLTEPAEALLGTAWQVGSRRFARVGALV